MRFPDISTAFAFLLIAGSVSAEEKTNNPLREALRPEHGTALETCEADLKKQLDTIAETETDADSLKAVAEIRTLLAAPRKEIASDKVLLGDWRVRSLQVGGLGAYAYPFFKCRIEREGKTGLRFRKNTGFQRRAGSLARDGKDRFLFMGGSYYTDESPIAYSTLQDPAVKADPERDSAGHLFQLGDGHFLILFTSEDGRGEVYELRK